MSSCQINFPSYWDRIITLGTFICKGVTYLCPFLTVRTDAKDILFPNTRISLPLKLVVHDWYINPLGHLSKNVSLWKKITNAFFLHHLVCRVQYTHPSSSSSSFPSHSDEWEKKKMRCRGNVNPSHVWTLGKPDRAICKFRAVKSMVWPFWSTWNSQIGSRVRE